MISSKDVRFDLKKIRRKTITRKNQCYNCVTLKRLLKGNPKNLINKLKIDPKSCSCSTSTEIFVFKKTKYKPKSFSSSTCIGRLKICQIGEIFESHSNIYNNSFLNKGLGLYLYSLGADWCHRRGLPLHSSTSPSNYAIRVWKSKRLRKVYRVFRAKNRWCMLPKAK